jgi:5'-nucleotidase
MVAATRQPLSRAENEAGESILGNLIADAQRAALVTDFAFMNPCGIRADLPAGSLTYRDLFSVHPFGNSLVEMRLTGQEIYDLLNQQWLEQPRPRMLNVSGLTYVGPLAPRAGTVVEVRKSGVPLDREARYSVTVNEFLAAGGDNFPVLTHGQKIRGGPVDVDALIAYLQSLPQPISLPAINRISLSR